MKKHKRLVYSINASEIFFTFGFIILVVVIIYFISRGIGDTDIKMELTKVYSIDQANAIKAVADSTVGKINNTIAVSAIFFTVAVAAISVFQFIKIRDIDRIKKELVKDVEKNNRLISIKMAKSSKKLDDMQITYEKKLKKLEEVYVEKNRELEQIIVELEDKIINLDLRSAKFEIDTNYIMAKDLQRGQGPLFEIKAYYEKVKELCELHPGIKENEFLANVYIDLAYIYI